jgi:hypothetical protein
MLLKKYNQRGHAMKNVLLIMMILVLSGCTVASLESKKPLLDAKTPKSPREYAACLAPAWQQYNSSTTSIETPTGYRISASATYNGVLALTDVVKAENGSTVRVYAQAEWGFGDWLKSARNCL